MISNDGHIKLIDFGFSKHLAEDKTYTNCGTPCYVAPEILKGTGHGYKSDIWSIGVLICELING
jgi:protein kinase A